MEMTTLAGILVIVAVYGWYMHRQGSRSSLERGVYVGAASVLAKQIHEKTLTRAKARAIMPMLTDEVIDEDLKLFEVNSKNASV